MVTISKMYKDGNDYEKDNYFEKDKINETELVGKLAKELKLEMTPELYNKLAKGEIGKLKVKIGVNEKHVSGTDITFSPDKSISIAYFLGTAEQKKNILKAYNRAVEKTLNFIEKELVQCRTTKDGKTIYEPTGNMICIKFTHGRSRENDPQLHIHAVIFNITKDSNGKIKALSNRAIWNNKALIQKYFERELFHQLKNDFSATYTDKKYTKITTGDIKLDKKLSREFSTRTKQIEKRSQELAEKNGGKAINYMNQATLETRKVKDVLNMKEMKIVWQSKIEKYISIKDYQKKLNCIVKTKTLSNKEFCKEVMIFDKRITMNFSTFTLREYEKEMQKYFGESVTNEQMQNYIKESKHMQKLGEISTQSQLHQIYATKQSIRLEKDIKQLAEKLSQKTEKINVEINTKELTNDQKKFIDLVLSKKIAWAQGNAGTGKTFALGRMKKPLEKAGYKIIALAPTIAAANELTKTGYTANTVSSFINPKNEKIRSTINSKTIIFVDEATMLSNQKMISLLSIAEQSGARLIFSGDEKQHFSVEKHDAVRVFTSGLPGENIIELTEGKRAKNPMMEELHNELGKQNFEKAEKIIIENTAEIYDEKERIKATVAEYIKAPKDSMMITYTNKLVDEINEQARKELQTMGLLDKKEISVETKKADNYTDLERASIDNWKIGNYVVVYGHIGQEIKASDYKIIGKDESNILLENGQKINVRKHAEILAQAKSVVKKISVGEEIIFSKSNNGYGIKKGDETKITKINGNIISVKIPHQAKEKSFDITRHSYFSYTYCKTSHKSQGSTVKHSIMHAESKHIDYRTMYVNVTRASDSVRIIKDDAEKMLVRSRDISKW
ncbi:relaxase domain-containing protein, partial [bacterium]|nr:relaxase domain-containing protein [bacterium]